MAPPFDEDAPSEAELRIAQAQLVGWLEGLFHGIQATLMSQQMAARAQLEEMRQRGLPSAGESGRTRAPTSDRGVRRRARGRQQGRVLAPERAGAVSRTARVPGNAPPGSRTRQGRAGAGPPAFPTRSRAGRPAPLRPSASQYATWGIRVGGYVIDSVIFVPASSWSWPCCSATAHALDVHLKARKNGVEAAVLLRWCPFLINGRPLHRLRAPSWSAARRGQTVGMMAVRVRAVRDETERGRSATGEALGRAVLSSRSSGSSPLTPSSSASSGCSTCSSLCGTRSARPFMTKSAGSVVIRVRDVTPGGIDFESGGITPV